MINSIACGKIILFGEHAVVHGYPGIALPVFELSTIVSIEKSNSLKYSTELQLNINQKKQLRKLINFLSKKFNLKSANIKIDSSIPLSSGFGSSASLSVALIRGINEFKKLKLSNDKINEVAYECEKLFHGTPSGIDNTVINFEKPIFFNKGKHEIINLKKPLKLFLIDTKVSFNTKDAILNFKKNYSDKKDVLEKIGKLATQGKKALEKGDIIELGKLMTKNHEFLKKLGVSIPEIDKIVEISLKAGAYGAKLTGKGFGGCVVILADKNINLPYEYITTVIE